MYYIEARINRILEELKGYVYCNGRQVTSYKMADGNMAGCEAKGLDTTAWKSFASGERWGGKDKHFWFRTEVTIPSEYEGKAVIYEIKTGREGQWDATNPQFLAYVNGKLQHGLDVNHNEVLLTNCAKPGETYTIALHAYTGQIDGSIELFSKIAVLDRNIEKLYYNLKVPYEVAVLLEKEDKRRIDILKYLNDAVNILDLRKPFSESFYQSVKNTDEYLECEFYKAYCGKEELTACCIGHTHLDVAWLWTLAQTREKAARSFSTALSLMEKYPEFKFMSSQPQLYEFIKEDHPEIYEEIKKRVAEGRWEPEGAMWLEADCNLASGEALVRQVLFGTRFFEKEFGVKNRILWLPDVFGYTAALPQILKKSGIDYFLTSKISWNEYNMMPYDTFEWQGIDGTEILTHFITTIDLKKQIYTNNPNMATYVGMLHPSFIMGAWQRYQQKYLSSEVLVTYGYGDGGGGPTREMVETAARLEKGIPGCPKVKLGTAIEFFTDLEKTVSKSNKLPKWVGELYLEFHRGTYTSMARNKKYNRMSEFLYQDAELLSVMADAVEGTGAYPRELLNQGWKTILLNQFHDILPGSSIKEVYEDSQKQYESIISTGRNVVKDSLERILSGINLENASLMVFNQLGFDRDEIVELDATAVNELNLHAEGKNIEICDIDGKTIPSQVTEDGKIILYAENIPSKGYKAYPLRVVEKAWSDGILQFNKNCKNLSNKFFNIKFDENYNIVSVFDKANNREILKKGQRGNVLQAFEDKPREYDAWEITLYYQEKMWEINDVKAAELIEYGPVRSVIRIERCFLDSTIVQKICIYNDIPRIDFITDIDWKEQQILLKAAFPIDVHTDKATYEIQYGNVERPTHWNTSWDYARFEVCAHKWADLSEDDYGISMLNDCKYGHDIKDGVMRLTLLKSGIDPNPDADKEKHHFVYSLYPHRGNWKEAHTVQKAYGLNCPVYTRFEQPHKGSLPIELSYIKVNSENVIIEVVKKAEDSEDTIVRVYECFNRRTDATLTFFKELLEVWECDLMENNISKLNSDIYSFCFEIKPLEILTFKIKM